jgi:hypothetical protein
MDQRLPLLRLFLKYRIRGQVGGNNPITTGGITINATTGDAYKDLDGGLALRTFKPCDDGSCEWVDDTANYMNSRRWYPTTETLSDGVVMIIGASSVAQISF